MAQVGMAVAALGFACETLGLLLLLGFGLCSWALPRDPGLAVLFAPIAGLASAMLANQWLTWFVPAPVALDVVGAGLVGLSAAMAWRARPALTHGLRIDWRPPIALGAGSLVAYLASLAFVFRTGAFTMASYPADPVHLYAPAAQWFVHSRFLPGAPVALASPILPYLDMGARAMPGTTGTLDAGLSMLTGWPVHAVFDPLDVLLVLLCGLAAFALVHVGLGFSKPAGVIATILVLANPLLQWAVVVGYQTELQSLPLLYGGLALVAVARRQSDTAPWVLAGAVLAPLVGAYAPVALLAAVLLVPTALTLAGRRLATRHALVDRRVVAGVGTGLLLSAPAAYWMLVRGGASVWLAVSNPSNPAPGGVARFYPLPYVVGSAPVTRFTMAEAPVFWGRAWSWAGAAAAVVLLGIVGLGLVALIRRRRFAELSVCVSAFAYLAYLALVVHTTYGFLKTAAYLVPASMALAAIGAVGGPSSLGRLLPFTANVPWPRRWPALPATAIAVGLASVVALEIVSSTEEQLSSGVVGPSISPSAARLGELRSIVPPGATVLIYDPHDWTTSKHTFMLNDEAAAYALTGYANTRLVVAGPPNRNSPYNYSAFEPVVGDPLAGDGFDFVLTTREVTPKLRSSFRLVWTQPVLGFALFQRVPREVTKR